ncbi:hypothetical protein N657DRAFT_689947 [Parathielavia appendiculata]|uniref:Uncharacterized protein n=1 Tax=Parathielavia appendiculata TaxID=2587402 RepID=A0AAN6U124_9PEZI|nr:hypothetical protein N657DRAFT_689947 [Parathielavia appendiculata]
MGSTNVSPAKDKGGKLAIGQAAGTTQTAVTNNGTKALRLQASQANIINELSTADPAKTVQEAAHAEVQTDGRPVISPARGQETVDGGFQLEVKPGQAPQEPAARENQPTPQMVREKQPNQAAYAKTETKEARANLVQEAVNRKAKRVRKTRRGRGCTQELDVLLDMLHATVREDQAMTCLARRDPAEVEAHWNKVREQLRVEDDEVYGDWTPWGGWRDTRPVWMR